MLVSKLVPLVVMGGIAAHSGGAIKDRIASATGAADKVVTRQRMTAIIEAAMLHAASGEELDLTSANCRSFIRINVRVKGKANADPSLDQWGKPLKCGMRGNLLTLESGGPDKAFGGKDDIKVSGNVNDF